MPNISKHPQTITIFLKVVTSQQWTKSRLETEELTQIFLKAEHD